MPQSCVYKIGLLSGLRLYGYFENKNEIEDAYNCDTLFERKQTYITDRTRQPGPDEEEINLAGKQELSWPRQEDR